MFGKGKAECSTPPRYGIDGIGGSGKVQTGWHCVQDVSLRRWHGSTFRLPPRQVIVVRVLTTTLKFNQSNFRDGYIVMFSAEPGNI